MSDGGRALRLYKWECIQTVFIEDDNMAYGHINKYYAMTRTTEKTFEPFIYIKLSSIKEFNPGEHDNLEKVMGWYVNTFLPNNELSHGTWWVHEENELKNYYMDNEYSEIISSVKKDIDSFQKVMKKKRE